MADQNGSTIFSDLARRIPSSFVNLLIRELNLREGDRAAELGCGSGELAARIAARGVRLDAIDQSLAMIQASRTKHPAPLIRWLHMSAEAFLSGNRVTYDGMYAMEAFHLFAEPRRLLAKIGDALRPRGAFALGWRFSEWEDRCSAAVVSVFERYGVPFRDWGYWTCPDLSDWLGSGWLSPVRQVIQVPSRSSVPQVAEFLCRIDRASRVERGSFDRFRHDMTKAVAALADNGCFEGKTRLGLTVVRRA